MGTNNTGLEVGQKISWSAQAIVDGAQRQLSDQDLNGDAYILYFYPKDNTQGVRLKRVTLETTCHE